MNFSGTWNARWMFRKVLRRRIIMKASYRVDDAFFLLPYVRTMNTGLVIRQVDSLDPGCACFFVFFLSMNA